MCKRPYSIHPEYRKGSEPLCLFLAILSIYLFVPACPVFALPENQKLPSEVECPPQQEVIDGLASMYVDQQKVQMELEDLLSGKGLVGISLQTLLVVDLDDDAAIDRRRRELQEAVSTSRPPLNRNWPR